MKKHSSEDERLRRLRPIQSEVVVKRRRRKGKKKKKKKERRRTESTSIKVKSRVVEESRVDCGKWGMSGTGF